MRGLHDYNYYCNTYQLSKKNDQEARSIDVIFSNKQERERELEELKVELDTKRRTVENVVGSMEEDVLGSYQVLTVENAKIRKVRT